MKPLLSLLLCLWTASAVQAQSPTSFGCSGTDQYGYYISSGTTSASSGTLRYDYSRLSQITTADGSRTTLCSAAAVGVSLNALAFNPVDNYLYAVSRFDSTKFSGRLYRLGENCQKLEIPVTGAMVKYSTNSVSTTDNAGGTIGSGTFDQEGNYYVNTSFASATKTGFINKILKISISGNTAAVVSSQTLTHATSAGTSKIQITDIIYDENSGQLLGSDKQTNKLYRINVSTGKITAIGSTGVSNTILGIYKNRYGAIRAIDNTGEIYSVNVSTGVFTRQASASDFRSGNADAASGCYAPAVLSGTVFIDGNGLSDGTVNGTPTGKAGTTQLHAVLIRSGQVVATTPVAADGTYSFSQDFSGSYSMRIGSVAGTVGGGIPNQNLPATHAFVGEYIGTGVGNDGKADGRLSLSVAAGESKANINFGIDTKPVVGTVSAETRPNPETNERVEVPALDRTDAEDGTPPTVRIFALPDAGTEGVLYYNGTAMTANQEMPDFQPSLFTFDPVDGPVTVVFDYAARDRAGVSSNTATVTMEFTVSLPITLTYFTGMAKAGKVSLQWGTTTETEAAYFAVERSPAGGAFTEIGRVVARGTSTLAVDYRFEEPNPAPRSYYRLRLVDADGSYTYGPTLAVAQAASEQLQVYPTVVTDNVHITRARPQGPLTVTIYSATGSRLLVKHLADGTGKISLAHLSRGTYRLVVVNPLTAELSTFSVVRR